MTLRINPAKSVLALALLALGAPALAAPAVTIDSDVRVARSSDEAGKPDSLVAPTDVVPGDRLVFAINYANTGGEAVENFVVTNPLPAAVALAAEDGGFEISIDGGKSYAPRVAGLTVADGEQGRRPAQLADVTHIRWVLPRLEAGVRGTVTYKAIVR